MSQRGVDSARHQARQAQPDLLVCRWTEDKKTTRKRVARATFEGRLSRALTTRGSVLLELPWRGVESARRQAQPDLPVRRWTQDKKTIGQRFARATFEGRLQFNGPSAPTTGLKNNLLRPD